MESTDQGTVAAPEHNSLVETGQSYPLEADPW